MPPRAVRCPASDRSSHPYAAAPVRPAGASRAAVGGGVLALLVLTLLVAGCTTPETQGDVADAANDGAMTRVDVGDPATANDTNGDEADRNGSGEETGNGDGKKVSAVSAAAADGAERLTFEGRLAGLDDVARHPFAVPDGWEALRLNVTVWGMGWNGTVTTEAGIVAPTTDRLDHGASLSAACSAQGLVSGFATSTHGVHWTDEEGLAEVRVQFTRHARTFGDMPADAELRYRVELVDHRGA